MQNEWKSYLLGNRYEGEQDIQELFIMESLLLNKYLLLLFL